MPKTYTINLTAEELISSRKAIEKALRTVGATTIDPLWYPIIEKLDHEIARAAVERGIGPEKEETLLEIG